MGTVHRRNTVLRRAARFCVASFGVLLGPVGLVEAAPWNNPPVNARVIVESADPDLDGLDFGGNLKYGGSLWWWRSPDETKLIIIDLGGDPETPEMILPNVTIYVTNPGGTLTDTIIVSLGYISGDTWYATIMYSGWFLTEFEMTLTPWAELFPDAGEDWPEEEPLPPLRDTDGDGIPDLQDSDDDGDGIPDYTDTDDDGDGLPDDEDTDFPGNGGGWDPPDDPDPEPDPDPDPDPDDPDEEQLALENTLIKVVRALHRFGNSESGASAAELLYLIQQDTRMTRDNIWQGGDGDTVLGRLKSLEDGMYATSEPGTMGRMLADIGQLLTDANEEEAAPGASAAPGTAPGVVRATEIDKRDDIEPATFEMPSGARNFTVPMNIDSYVSTAGTMGEGGISVGSITVPAVMESLTLNTEWYVGSPLSAFINIVMLGFASWANWRKIGDEVKRQ